MNEQLGKLAEEAKLLGPGSRIGNAHEATEKFAELVVRDCIQTLRSNGYDDAAQCLQDIHFGLDHPV
jgi:hypothetical protein